jgi:hypothetical protein
LVHILYGFDFGFDFARRRHVFRCVRGNGNVSGGLNS